MPDMELRLLFTYVTIYAFCIVFSFNILSKTTADIGSSSEVSVFRKLTLSYILFLLADMLWFLGKSGYLLFSPSLCQAFGFATMLLIATLSCFWFRYAELRIRPDLTEKLWFRVASLVPLGLVVILNVISLRTGLIFSIGEEGFTFGPGYWLQFALNVSYPLFVTVHALSCAAGEPSALKRKEYHATLSFIVVPTLAVFVSGAIPMTPIVGEFLFFGLFLIFINLQKMQIYNDALTGLNNRRRADQYLDTSIAAAAREPFYLFMIDVNFFKEINDALGHLEGDRVLQAVARALKQTCARYNGFAARWGGDEFILIVRLHDLPEPFSLVNDLKERMLEAGAALNLPRRLSAGIGCSLCSEPSDRPGDLMSRADQMLYQDKRRVHGLS